MKKKLLILLSLVSLFELAGCRNSNEYRKELEKFKSALKDEGYVLQDGIYYKGIGYECSADSPYAKTYSGTSEDNQEVSFYYCSSTEKERPQKYYSIDVEKMEMKFFSNKYLMDLANDKAESDSYMLDNHAITFNLTYDINDDSIKGTYQENKTSNNNTSNYDILNYDIEYDYEDSEYSCKISFVSDSNVVADKPCADDADEALKQVSLNLKNELNNIIDKHDIDLNKILD